MTQQMTMANRLGGTNRFTKLLNAFEYLYSVVGLMLMTGGPLALLVTGGASQGDGSSIDSTELPLIRMVFLLVYMIAVALLAIHWKKALRTVLRAPLIWVVLAYVILSFLWSTEPDISLRRGIMLLASSLFGFYLASRYTIPQQIRIFCWSIGLAVILSLLFVAVPGYGVQGGIHLGAWRGIYVAKNLMGRVMALGCVAMMIRALAVEQRKWLYWTGSLMCMLLVLLSTSKGALITLLTLLILLYFYRLFRWRYTRMIPALTFMGVAFGYLLLLIAINLENALGALGKDLTFTGRTGLWEFALETIADKPLFGYGYTAFWQYGGTSLLELSGLWDAPHSHNGFLDTGIDLGLIGLGLIFSAMFVMFTKSMVYMRQNRGPEGLWPLLYLSFFVLGNLAESSLLNRNDFIWCLFVTASFSVGALSTLPKKVYPKPVRARAGHGVSSRSSRSMRS